MERLDHFLLFFAKEQLDLENRITERSLSCAGSGSGEGAGEGNGGIVACRCRGRVPVALGKFASVVSLLLWRSANESEFGPSVFSQCLDLELADEIKCVEA